MLWNSITSDTVVCQLVRGIVDIETLKGFSEVLIKNWRSTTMILCGGYSFFLVLDIHGAISLLNETNGNASWYLITKLKTRPTLDN